MKILVISNYYPPHYIGGYELACFNTVEYLKKSGHTVYVLTGDYLQKSHCFEEVYRGLKYINYDKPSFWDKHQVETHNYKVTQNVIKDFSPDIVYLWSLRLISLSPAMAVQNLHIKKIFEIGDFWMKGYLSSNFLSKIKRMIKNILPFTIGSKIELSPAICVSKWVAKEMEKTYETKQIHIIPNGTNIQQKSKKNLNKNIKYLFCGRADYTKGIDIALKALGNLKDRGIDNFEFNIYGSGNTNYINKCKNIVNALQLNKQVTFYGKTDDVQKLYSQHDILLMPTRMKEPFGLVIIEAMAAGVVVIATNAYGPAEIINNNKDGLLFKEEDVSDLTNSILKLHNNKYLYHQLREEAFYKVFNKYNLENVKKRVEDVLLNIVYKDKL